MATPARASAHAPALPAPSENVTAAPDAMPSPDAAAEPSLCPLQDSAQSLALQASDDINNIHDVHRAYACLEGLIEPQRLKDPAEVYMNRSELGALLRLLNAELQRRICTADTAIKSVRVALAGSVTQ
jgi:hypothetical protein